MYLLLAQDYLIMPGIDYVPSPHHLADLHFRVTKSEEKYE